MPEQDQFSVKMPCKTLTEVREFEVPKRSLLPSAYQLGSSAAVPLIFSNLKFHSLSPSDAASLQLTWNITITRDAIGVRVRSGSSEVEGIGGDCGLQFTYPNPPLTVSDGYGHQWRLTIPELKARAKGQNPCCFTWEKRGVAGRMANWTDKTTTIRVTLNLQITGFSASTKNEHWPEHKTIFVADSEVLKMMLQSDIKDCEVIIPDINPEAVKLMMTYLYNGCCKLEGSNLEILIDLFKLANLYEIEELTAHTVSKLMEIITVENAPEVYTLAEHHGQNCVMEKALLVAKSKREAFSKNPAHFKELVESFPNFMFQLFTNP